MLLSVPAASSSLGLPATVTRPGFAGCLNWRWLPLVATSSQPSLRRSSSTSLTFMRQVCHDRAHDAQRLRQPAAGARSAEGTRKRSLRAVRLTERFERLDVLAKMTISCLM